MALPKRSTPSPPPNASTRDLKQRVITCLNKLSDRDTQAIATTELESIARNLNHDSFSIFLNCIYYTDPSQKSPVRKQCVRLFGFLSEIHADALSPFLSKMLANIVRRLRDSDTAVRSACLDTVAAMAAKITKPSFSVFLKPLMEAILLEQDYNSQIGSALCLASAIDASPDPEPAQLQRLLPRLVKLLKSESFKAKPALLSLIGSIVGAGETASRNVLDNLIPCMVAFLSSEDWAARKGAAEVLARLAVVERDLLSEFKSSCLSTFESRRYDKVKVVRDTMNRMMDAWKDVPNVSDEVSPPSQSKSSSRENASDGRYPPVSKNSGTEAFELSQSKKIKSPMSRPPQSDRSSAITVRQRSPLKSIDGKSNPGLFGKLDRKKPPNWKIEISVPHTPPFTEIREDNLEERGGTFSESRDNERNRCQKPETRRALFKSGGDKMHKFGGLKSGSRVVPFHQEESLESTVVVSNTTEELYGNPKNSEDLSLIRKQLVQIENQQSSLLDLLQRFIGTSQNGMRSLETRVHGLEIALDEISYDLAVSTRRLSNPDTARNSCCSLPGAEFLSSKFWRRTEGRYSTSKFSPLMGTPSLAAMRNISDRDSGVGPLKLENRRLRLQGGGGFVVNPLADMHSEPSGSSEVRLNSMPKNAFHDSEGREVRSGNKLNMASSITGLLPADVINRSSA